MIAGMNEQQNTFQLLPLFFFRHSESPHRVPDCLVEVCHLHVRWHAIIYFLGPTYSYLILHGPNILQNNCLSSHIFIKHCLVLQGIAFLFFFHLFLINDLQYTAADVSPFFYCHFICILRNFFLGSSLSEFTLKISPPHAQNCCVFSGTPSTLCRQNLIIPNATFPDFSVLQPENLSCLHFFPL